MIRFLNILSYLWLLSEIILMITKRSKVKEVKKKRDRGSMILLWIMISVGIIAGFFLANRGRWNSLNYYIYVFGIFIFSVGLFIRWLSIIQLKNAFTVDVAINQIHELKTDGLYKIVRHPSYLGMMLIVSGLSIGMNSFFSFLVMCVPVFFAVSYRIYVEEAVLTEEFGEIYKEYAKTTKRIVPFLY